MRGSSAETVTMVSSLEVQVRPVRAWPVELVAWIVCVSPTTMLSEVGCEGCAVAARQVYGEGFRVAPHAVLLNTHDAG